MTSSCRIFENDVDLGKEALVPIISSYTLRKFNKRQEIPEQIDDIKVVDIEKHLKRSTEEPKQYAVRMNSSTAAHMVLHKSTQKKTDMEMYKFKRDDNLVTISVLNPEWEHEEDASDPKKKERGALIGKLAEKAILNNVFDARKVHVCYALPYENFIHFCSRETDGFHRIGNKIVAIEVKSLGKLTSYKPRLFNNRIYKMVTKSLITGSGETFVVIRDDARMNLKNEKKRNLGIVEVHFWEDVSRLLPMDAEQIKSTHLKNLEYVANKNVEKNHKDGIQFKGQNSKIVGKNACGTTVPYFKHSNKNKKTLKKHVVVGPNVPYYDFKLKDVFLTYRHKYEESWTTRSEQVYIIANSWEDIRDMFKSYRKTSKNLNIIFYVNESRNFENYSSICAQFQRKNNLNDEQFRSWVDLGTKLYNKQLTHWEQPIPCVLLLLGEGQHVPKLLITARLSFGVLVKAGETYTTGINLEEIPFPDLIAVLGTKEECISGVTMAANAFPRRCIVGFGSDNNMYIHDENGRRTLRKYTDLDKELKERQFPMYTEFYYAENEWKAE